MASTDLSTAINDRARQIFRELAAGNRVGTLATRELRAAYFDDLWKEAKLAAEAELEWHPKEV